MHQIRWSPTLIRIPPKRLSGRVVSLSFLRLCASQCVTVRACVCVCGSDTDCTCVLCNLPLDVCHGELENRELNL